MPREHRESCSPVTKIKEKRPGPADYQRLKPSSSNERPLTAKRSFLVLETFNKASRDVI